MWLKTLSFIVFCSLVLAPVLAVPEAIAQEPERYVETRLLTEKNRITPGETFTIGIEQVIYPKWHTYWKNPGDSGEATSIRWDMPADFKAAEIQWPAPEKLPVGPLTNYGYSGKVVLLQDITAPATLSEGPLTLTANIDLLVCEEICIPESSKVQITLNNGDSDHAVDIAKARANLPVPVSWDAQIREDNGSLVVHVIAENTAPFEAIQDVALFPVEWGLVDNTAKAELQILNTGFQILQKRGDRKLTDLDSYPVILTYKDAQNTPKAIELNAKTSSSSAVENEHISSSFIAAIIFALLGGMILNLMPCVFPVLSMKALSLVNMQDKEITKARLHGLAYTAGILVSFGAVAGVLLALKAGGAEIGWGFQLQNPAIVLLLAYLLFLIGLNLSGMFDLGNNLGNIGGHLTRKKGISGSFFTGVLATLVATPCTAPFMGAAMGYALTQPAIISMMVFLTLGFGLALPYLLLCYIPSLRGMLPKPGAWMETFRQFLAFPMFASAAWLIWVLSQQAEHTDVLYALLGMVSLAFGIWILKTKIQKGLLIILVLLSFGFAIGTLAFIGNHAASDHHESFSQARLDELVKESTDPVFVNMTAAWCITCKVNERVALNIPSTQAVFKDKGVHYLKGDWTNRNPEITKYLQNFGRNGVPLYVYYKAPDDSGKRPDPVVLPSVLTPGIVKNALKH